MWVLFTDRRRDSTKWFCFSAEKSVQWECAVEKWIRATKSSFRSGERVVRVSVGKRRDGKEKHVSRKVDGGARFCQWEEEESNQNKFVFYKCAKLIFSSLEEYNEVQVNSGLFRFCYSYIFSDTEIGAKFVYFCTSICCQINFYVAGGRGRDWFIAPFFNTSSVKRSHFLF